ncbi:MAG: fused MFS/spermidine synthase, partial [Deltaproteobacteria bacterium]|nr:fused MFS/spermidine synthase [Deltaproteobacteria bacterium]
MEQTGELRKHRLILVFFFLTGLTGLAYELVWIRLLILSFGSTQFAITTVLATFMAGLALGSVIFGRVVDKYRSPLKVYGIIEILLGIYCVISPLIFYLVKTAYLYLSPITPDATFRADFEPMQFVLSLVVLIIPTTLMGGTLPALVKYLARTEKIGFNIAMPYAVNTLGAVTGCLATGLFALYYFGVNATVYLAGVIDIIVGALILVLYRKTAADAQSGAVIDQKAPKPIFPGQGSRRINAVIVTVFYLSGFTSLAYEVLWTRVLSLVLGSSVYAFTIMLATFLAGIGIGSIAFAPFVDRCKRPLFWFALLEAVIGLFAIASIFIYRELPFIFFNLKQSFGDQFWLFLVFKFLLASAVMIVPTLAMGAIFPLVIRIYSEGVGTIGKKVGNIYSVNTAGAILGSFAGGFILVPVLGAQAGVMLMAGVNILLSFAILYISAIPIKWKYISGAAFACVFALIALTLPSWEKMAMTTGMYVNDYGEKADASFESWRFDEKLLYYHEGLNAIITVRSSGPNGEVISYQANGKYEARSENGLPPKSWAILGHLPAMLHDDEPKDALVIGLGSGVTLGMMEHYPYESFDVVELEHAVIDAARFFSKANHNALDDPRVRMHLTDGRSFLASVDKKYDVIVSGVSDPWISGVSNLFTHDYFMELKSKLTEDGLVALWFSNYRNTPEDFKTGLNSFAQVFPNTSIWFHYKANLDLVVIGTVGAHELHMDRLKAVFGRPEVNEELRKIEIASPYDVFSLYLTGGDDLRGFLKGAGINTDERPILEFSLPKSLYGKVNGAERVTELLAASTEIAPPATLDGMDESEFYLELGKNYNR